MEVAEKGTDQPKKWAAGFLSPRVVALLTVFCKFLTNSMFCHSPQFEVCQILVVPAAITRS